MRIGFIGLGNVGGKLAGSLARNGYDLVVRDLDRDAARPFLDGGAGWADSPKEMAEQCEVVITCLPSPAACSAVRLDGARLTSDDILARTCSMSPRSRCPRTNAASLCSIRSEKVDFSSAAPTMI